MDGATWLVINGFKSYSGQKLHNNIGQIVHTYVHLTSATKQYDLVLTKGRWCSAAGKVTAGLAVLWVDDL